MSSEPTLGKLYYEMMRSCYNENSKPYKSIGAKGIKVCDEWKQKNGFLIFFNWSIMNGYNDDLSIDRINVNGNYEPNNCRWSTRIEQANNKTNTIKVLYNGIYLSLYDISILEHVDLTELREKYKIYNNLGKALTEIKQ